MSDGERYSLNLPKVFTRDGEELTVPKVDGIQLGTDEWMRYQTIMSEKRREFPRLMKRVLSDEKHNS